eukprot:jgi/Mesen1/1670/ME000136S00554
MATQRRVNLEQNYAEGGYAGNSAELHSTIELKLQADMKSKIRSNVESIAWLVACLCVVYYGDSKSNLVHLLLHDRRIHQQPFFVACLCVLVNTCIFLYLGVWVRHVMRNQGDFNIVAPGAIPTATILGFFSFFLFVYSLWPIFSILALPLLYVLFMGMVVISPYMPPYTKKNERTE